MKTLKIYIIPILLTLLLPTCRPKYPVQEDTKYKVVKVVDGDTYDVLLPDFQKARIRMSGIDAPEKGQDFSKKSTSYLRSLIQSKYVTLTDISLDQYGRYVAFTHLADGREAGEEMLKAGYAWHFKKYDKSRRLAALEQEARRQGVGLWADPHPVEPWIERTMRWKGYKSVEIKQLKIAGKLPDREAAEQMPHNHHK